MQACSIHATEVHCWHRAYLALLCHAGFLCSSKRGGVVSRSLASGLSNVMCLRANALPGLMAVAASWPTHEKLKNAWA